MYELWEYLTIAQAFALVGAAWVLVTLVGWFLDYRRATVDDVDELLVERLDRLVDELNGWAHSGVNELGGELLAGQRRQAEAVELLVERLTDEQVPARRLTESEAYAVDEQRPAGVPAPRPVMGAQR